MAVKKGKIVAISSVKGGTGKTNTVLKIALNSSKKVLIVDLDLSGRALAASLNLSLKSDIFELINDLETKKFNRVDDYVSNYKNKFDIIAAPNDPRKAIKLNNGLLNLAFSQLTTQYDLILVDTNHVINETNLVLFDIADEILFVISSNLIDFKNLKTMINIYKNIDKTNYKTILNLSINKNTNNYETGEIRTLINSNVDYIIPKDLYNKNYENDLINGKILNKKNKIFQKIAKSIEGGELDEKIS